MIPTVSWGNENTFEFCFLGIPKGSTVAVSTYVVSEHDNRCDQKEFFMKGYREMLRRIEPERIICYNTPFPEMEGNIAFVDYELSSWKYQEKEYEPSPYSKYITGELLLPENSGIIINEVMWNLLEKVWAAHTVESGGQIRISRRIKDISEIQVRSKQQSCQTVKYLRPRSVTMGMRKWSGMKQIMEEEINTQTRTTMKLVGMKWMDIQCRDHQSIILMRLLSLSNIGE